MQEWRPIPIFGLFTRGLLVRILTLNNKQRNGNMKTNQQLETEAILSMVENMKVLEQQLADAKNRIDSLEKVIANQRAVINELQ
jgi:hypothetical protein